MRKHSLQIAVLGVVSISSYGLAASATWTGGDTANPTLFSDGLNWNPGTVPGNAPDVGTFSSANNGTTITLPATVGTLSATSFGSTGGPNLAFDANAVAYTIGATANGSNYVVSASGANISMAAGAAAQVINPTIILANRTTAGYSVNNSSTTNALTLNGNITSQVNVAGAGWVVTFGGATGGTKVINGVISDTFTTGTGTIAKISAGNTVLNNANTYYGGTQLNGGALTIGNKAALGTGAVSVIATNDTLSAGTDLSGANAVTNAINYINNIYTTTIITGTQNLELSGPIALNSNGGTTAYTANGGQTFNVTNTAVTTFSGTVSGNGTQQVGLTKTGTGTLVLSGANNTFGGAAQGVAVNGGTLLVNNTVGSGTGASGVVTVNTGGTFGGNGTISGLLQVNSGGAFRPGAATGTSTAVFSSTSTGNSALVLNTGSTTLFDVLGTGKGTDYDNFTTAGKVNYGGDFTINLNNVPTGTTVYDLFSFVSVGGTAFNTITLTGTYSGALTNTSGNWSGTFGTDTVSFAQSTGDLTVTSSGVPEPAAGLFLVAAGALLGKRRRS